MTKEVYDSDDKNAIATSIDECVKTGPVSEELWGWSMWCDKIGKILFWVMIIWGIITSIIVGITVNKYGGTKFSFNLFISELIQRIIYAWLEYIIYHIISILISSLATITQNTRVTAKLTEYQLRKHENSFASEDSKVKSLETDSGDM